MRVVVTEFISLDGVVQAPGGPKEDTDGGFQHGGWSMPYFDPEVMGGAYDEQTQRAKAVLQGRRTWQVMASAWPQQSGDPFADWINNIQKYVVSDSLTEADTEKWAPTEIIRGAELLAKVAELRESGDGELVISGSASVARQLLEADLVDELFLMIEPVVLGGGKTIYPTDGALKGFELISTEQAKTGVQVCRFERVR